MLGENLSSRGYFASTLRSNVQQFIDNSFFFLMFNSSNASNVS